VVKKKRSKEHYKRNPYTEYEKQVIKKNIVLLIVFICVGAILFFLVTRWLPDYYLLKADNTFSAEQEYQFISNFWGVIIGAFIAGIATVVTAFVIIQNNKKIDYHRERMECLPVLSLEYKEKLLFQDGLIKDTNDELKYVYNNETILGDCSDSESEQCAVFFLRNIGKGTAFSIRTELDDYTGFDSFSCNSLRPNEDSIIVVRGEGKSNDNITLYYDDIYENCYRQVLCYSGFCQREHQKTTCYPPILCKKTHRLRYTQ